jgi:L-seryl-tRNA(Ser) seleniumtransferase
LPRIDTSVNLCSNQTMADNPFQEILRQIPAVDQILQRPELVSWVERTSRAFVVSQIQAVLQDVRDALRAGQPSSAKMGALVAACEDRLRMQLRPNLRFVINATGVILHTNLGRAPLSITAQESLSALSGQYTNLEYDLNTGDRYHRDKHIEPLLNDILGCEAATVVNNNAAAVFLILNTLAGGKEVVVSRGELIEIGGSFRIPDILTRSGAILREVGTTNKTRIEDFASAIGPDTALLLRIHPSNYRIRGFTERPTLSEMVDLGRKAQLPLVEDVGSGCLTDLRPYGISEEPLVQESVAAGVDLVCFSADKLLGGPQAGIIAGARKWVNPIRKNPLMRTYRVEKLIYGALEATLLAYRSGREMAEIPVLHMITMTSEVLRVRARSFARKLRAGLPEGVRILLAPGKSVVGGGSCPDCELATVLLSLESDRCSPNALDARLRSQDPAIIVRVEADKTLIDLRTVLRSQELLLLQGLVRAFAG